MARRRKKTGMDLDNIQDLFINLSLLGGVVLKRGSARAIKKAALHLERKFKERLNQEGSGRIYGSHQASAPGEPPSSEHGQLMGSITHVITGGSGPLPDPGGSTTNIKANVGTPLAKGRHLEEGYKTKPFGNQKMDDVFVAPRPWFGVTVDAEKGPIQKLIVFSLRDTFKKAKLKKSKKRKI